MTDVVVTRAAGDCPGKYGVQVGEEALYVLIGWIFEDGQRLPVLFSFPVPPGDGLLWLRRLVRLLRLLIMLLLRGPGLHPGSLLISIVAGGRVWGR